MAYVSEGFSAINHTLVYNETSRIDASHLCVTVRECPNLMGRITYYRNI